MMNEHSGSSRWQRHEAKYLIDEKQAATIRRYARDHLPLDPHAQCQQNNEYPILSTYLDSHSRQLLRQAILRQVSRHKLRVRAYRDFNDSKVTKTSHVFLEVKRKIKGVVHKTRARVTSDLADALMWSQNDIVNNTQIRRMPELGDALIWRQSELADTMIWCQSGLFEDGNKLDDVTRMNVDEFAQLRRRINARPMVGTFYVREAYEGDSLERVRITMDRKLHYGVIPSPESGQQEVWWPANPGGVILEIKFSNTYPFWVANMLRRVEILRRGVCKYVICSQAACRMERKTFEQGVV